MKHRNLWASLDPFWEAGDILGRKVANKGFIDSLFQADPFDEYHFFLPDRKSILNFKKKIENSGYNETKIKVELRIKLPAYLQNNNYYCFHLSDCINYPAWLAKLRNLYSRVCFPVTSITHSLSYTHYLREFLPHLWSGSSKRDCIIASSLSGKQVIQAYFAQLQVGLGLDKQKFPVPRVEKIPLGVNTRQYLPPTIQQKKAVRKKLEIGSKQTCILILGRIAANSKMDILPVFRAIQRLLASGVSACEFVLVLAGWTEDKDDLSPILQALARNIGIDFRLVTRPAEPQKVELLQAADIFLSIADNPQETFGLTLCEAAAMGLPVIASDYDGYKDIVEQGQTGLLIPTLSRNCFWIDELAPLLFDSHNHLLRAQATAVDVPALALALHSLIQNPDLRLEMAGNARARAEKLFDWQGVIDTYLKLWDKLWQQPVNFPLAHEHPLIAKFCRIFDSYPSEFVQDDILLIWTKAGKAVYRKQEFPLIYSGLEHIISPELVHLLVFSARKKITFSQLAQAAAGLGYLYDQIEFAIMWCIKQDLLQAASPKKN